MKIALCFLISYDHVLNKEKIWKEWIEPNKDIVNIYFHYTDKKKIKSDWVLQHCLPEEKIVETSYFHMLDAYLALVYHSYYDDEENTWFCFLTESCVPIVSPDMFRLQFFQNGYKSIMGWKKAWWNVHLHKRANLRSFPESIRLGNDPWFTLTRRHVNDFMHFRKKQEKFFYYVCSGGLANESIFAMLFHYNGQLHSGSLINQSSTISNWERMSTATSPYVFKTGHEYEVRFIENTVKKNKYAMFLRKVDVGFPDDILMQFLEIDKPKWQNVLLCFYYEYKTIWFVLGFFLFFMSFALWVPWIEALNYIPDL